MAILIGTSGFSYRHWLQKFYPLDIEQSGRLSYYAKFFNTVELNVSFYRLPSENAFKKWYDNTPSDFKFALKGSRYITHTKKLFSSENSLKLFFERAKILGEKLSAVLWQFPQNFESNPERLKDFLKILQKYKCRHAFEFRHESWVSDEIYDILRKYNAALVITDSPIFPKVEARTADFSYIRFHGGKELYLSEYSQKELDVWAEKISKWRERGDVYAYFNNDANAYAVKNALELKKLLEE